MPITSSATIALRKDRRRAVTNLRRKRSCKRAMDNFKAKLSSKSLQAAVSQIDKMVKWHLFHQNKADRLKSQLSKLLTTASSAS